MIFLSIFFFKNLNRIVFEDKNYTNYPWPKFYSYEKKNNFKENKFIKIDGKKIYYPSDKYCMLGNAPCGDPNNILKISKINNYLIFIPSL